MKSVFLLFFVLIIPLFAYQDSDMDGVEDSYDLCKRTLFSDLVDKNGCTIKSIGRSVHYDIIIGTEYSQVNYTSKEVADTINTSLQVDIYMNQWWIQGLVSYYDANSGFDTSNGLNDTILDLFYQYPQIQALSLTMGIGIVLPTYDSRYNNEEIDYSVMIDFQYDLNDSMYLFGGLGYTWTRDKDIVEETYQNTPELDIGIGYLYGKKGIWSIAYYQNESMYEYIETMKSLGVGYSYQVNPDYFISSSYGYGLSDSASDHSFLLRLGYSF